ncbi:MAG TPA: type II secretion system F family protein [Pirellulales bacterium]|jgi:type IV pilus assembly protein PilC|nr:type II secretion system F family protein [Pirellulales bacterium]
MPLRDQNQRSSSVPFRNGAAASASASTQKMPALTSPMKAGPMQWGNEASASEDAEDLGGLFPRRIRKYDLIYVTNQLAIMVDTGITLSVALGSIAEQEQNPSLRSVLNDLKRSVEAGEDFSAALARYPKVFDKTYVSLVKASEASGKLGEMLNRVSIYLRKEVETRSKVRAAMAYPAVMMVVATAVTIFLLTYILPKFAPIFQSRGKSLPGPTKLMMGASEMLINYWYLWLMGAISLVAGFFYGKRTEPGRQVWDWVRINTPIVGPMSRKVAISRSIRTLGTMIASGVSMLDAIRLSGDVTGNYYYEKLWSRVLDQVTAGKRICETLRGDPLFPAMLVQMIASGEETGKLDEVLERVSVYYDQEVETSLKTVTSLIEPIMITGMGFVVGGIGLSLLMPIFSLSRPT